MLREYRIILPCTALEYEVGYRYVTGTSKRVLKGERSLAHFVDNGVVGRQTEREADPSLVPGAKGRGEARVSTTICFPTVEASVTVGRGPRRPAKEDRERREEIASVTIVLVDQDRGCRENVFRLTDEEKAGAPVTVLDAVKLHQEMTCNKKLVVGGSAIGADWLGGAEVYCCAYVLVRVAERREAGGAKAARKGDEQARALAEALIRGISRTTVKVLARERTWSRLSLKQLQAIERYEFRRARGWEGDRVTEEGGDGGRPVSGAGLGGTSLVIA